jgi:Predicted membrane protein
METPVYVINGFLDSGKTSFSMFTIKQDYFSDGTKTLLIVCEEGEEEYDEAALLKHNVVKVVIEEEENFTEEYLNEMKQIHSPDRVIIEYNGMWKTSELLKMNFPKEWEVVQIISLIDASTYEVYSNNMKSLIMDTVRESDMVIFNRATKDMRIADYRRSIKAVNRTTEVVFETGDGELGEIIEELPFDIMQDTIEIEDYDYGIWYMDAMEHPEKYKEKTVKFNAMVLKPETFKPEIFVPGRMAMTCCADDTTFIGFICNAGETAKELKTKQWVSVTAKIRVEFQKEYKGKGPVLYAENIDIIKKLEDELVYFN